MWVVIKGVISRFWVVSRCVVMRMEKCVRVGVDVGFVIGGVVVNDLVMVLRLNCVRMMLFSW